MKATLHPQWPLPRAAYVHVPFCRHHCGYCNFSVLAGHDDRTGDFLKALEIELRQLGEPRTVDTLFIGGGTPTHLCRSDLELLLRMLAEWFPLTEHGEYSCEANPRDISVETLQTLVEYGVNRISLGVQSFDAQHLATLERDHDAAIIGEAVNLTAKYLPNISLDLIFGVPGQSPSQWHADLQCALSLPIKHLSTYGLTFEKGTRFWNQRQHGVLAEVGEDAELEMYQLARKTILDTGWMHYEISNFASPGFACRHNRAYWEGRGWFAVGPGAARFVDGRREVNHRSPMAYIHRLLRNESATAESELISRETWARERLAFGLRMIQGVDLDELVAETGINLLQVCEKEFSMLSQLGLIYRDTGHISLTEKGLVVSDSVLSRLL